MEIPKLQKDSYANMLEIFPNKVELGNVSIEKFVVDRKSSDASISKAIQLGDKHSFCPPGKYIVMKINGQTMMGDTPMEKITNQRIINLARGRVLIAGLGIGLILHPILQKPNVNSVDVVELNPSVIQLVKPTLACYEDRLHIHQCDIREWQPPDLKWDVIYLDIWPQYGDHIIECPRLFDKYKEFVSKDGYIGAWMFNEAIKHVAEEYGVLPVEIYDALWRMYKEGKDIEAEGRG